MHIAVWGFVWCRYYTAFAIIGKLLYLKRTKSWRAGLSDAEENAVWDAAHEKLAVRALTMIQDLRGFWVKAGQYMSSRSDVTPAVCTSTSLFSVPASFSIILLYAIVPFAFPA
jgi:predicted unusual protein kinase regulating ubiquinone biosynthesis (AarF/ABC1/UbiB family)